MKNSALQQSLIELEENLKNLESARTQVDNMSGKVEQVIQAFTKILKQIELLQKEFNNEQGYFKQIISKSIADFTTTLEKKKADLSTLSDTLTQNLSDSIEVNKSSLIVIIEKTKTDLSILSDTLNQNLRNAIENNKTSIINTIEASNKSISESTYKLNSSLSLSLSETNKTLDLFQRFIADTIETISKLDFEKSMREIKTDLISIEKKQKRNQIITLVTMLVCFATVISILLLVK